MQGQPFTTVWPLEQLDENAALIGGTSSQGEVWNSNLLGET